MPKTCDQCGLEFKGFGTTCAPCRKVDKTEERERKAAMVPCAECGKGIDPEANSVNVNGKEYHVECFTCHECIEPITGSYKTDKKTGRRTCKACQTNRPCAGCRQPLGNGPSTVMGDQAYHPECLKCEACDKLLTNMLVPWEGHLLCMSCGDDPKASLAAKYANEDYYDVLGVDRDALKKDIANGFKKKNLEVQNANPDNKEKNAKNRKRIVEAYKTLIVESKRALYDEHLGKAFNVVREGEAAADDRCKADLCAVCGLECTVDYLRSGGKHFHDECFKCQGCSMRLKSAFCTDPKNGRIYCSQDCVPTGGFHGKALNNVNPWGNSLKPKPGAGATTSGAKPASKPTSTEVVLCSKCGKRIEGTVIKAMGKTFHEDCFTCSKCNAALSSRFYISEDGVLCQSCGQQKPAKSPNVQTDAEMCMRCGEVFTGEYVVANGLKFHKDCFACDKCGNKITGSYAVEEASGKFAIKVRNIPRNRFICESCIED